MNIRVLAFFVLAFLVLVTPSWAQLSCNGSSDGEPVPCPITFSPGTNETGTYDFTLVNGGLLIVKFDTVLTTFTLTVTLSFPTNEQLQPELDPSEFPVPGTVCVQYQGQPADTCVQYDLSGSPALPVKNVDYKGLIDLTLSYSVPVGYNAQTPAFGHAPGDTNPPAFTVNILDAYSEPTICGLACDPTMHGKIPTPSSLIGLKETLTSSNTGCPLTLMTTNVASGQKPQVEVTLQENNCAGTGGLRDKTASISVSAVDNSGNFVYPFPSLKNVEANKFHWDAKDGLNEYDISTDGLANGTYQVTVFSKQISPESACFAMTNGAPNAPVTCP